MILLCQLKPQEVTSKISRNLPYKNPTHEKLAYNVLKDATEFNKRKK